MRSALALDTDEQRLLIVDAFAQFLRPFGKDSVGGPLEKEEGGTRLELLVVGQELGIALLERAEMLLLFLRQALEHLAPAGIRGQLRGPRVELQAAALGGNRNPQ